MSLKDVNLDTVPDIHHVPAGERQLRLESAEVKPHKNNPENSFVMLRFSVVDDPNAKQITNNVFFPTDEDDEERTNSKCRKLKALREAMDILVEKSNPAQFCTALTAVVGKTVWANLTEKDDPQYGTSNEIRSWVPSRR